MQPFVNFAGKWLTTVASFGCAALQDGELYTCGSNENGQLGSRPQAASEMRPAPGRVTALESHRVVHAACGQGHTVAVLDSGALAAFGAAEFGQLGHGGESTMQPLPRVVRGTPGMRFARFAHVCIAAAARFVRAVRLIGGRLHRAFRSCSCACTGAWLVGQSCPGKAHWHRFVSPLLP